MKAPGKGTAGLARPLRIGWKEVIDLPGWGIRGLLAKADTGARGSAIDVESVRRVGSGRVRFSIVLHRKDRSDLREVEADIVETKRVRSSNGEVQERYVVRTEVRIGKVSREVDFSLVSRHRMICRALLGRHAMEGAFLVDSGAKYLHGPRVKPRKIKRAG